MVDSYAGREVKKKTASYIMQELIRPTPSELFTERAKVIPEFISAKGELFAEIREHSEKYGVWFLEDRKEDGKERGVLKGYLHKLLAQGYIFLKDRGVYSVYENVEDRVIIEQKFVHHGEQVIGAWHGESLAYRCGIINEKPVAEYVLSNRQNAPQWVKIRVGDTDVFKMKPPVPVTKENETLMNTINLLAYASEHPEYKEKVLRYLDEQGIGAEKILEPDILKKSTRRIQRYISDVFTKENGTS